MSECSICNHPQLRRVEAEIAAGKINVREGASQLGVTYQAFWRHLKEHTEKHEVKSVQDVNESVKLLVEVLRKLKDKLDFLTDDASQGEWMRHLPNFVRELRGLAIDIAKLQQQLVESPTVLVQNVIMQQTQMQTFMLEQACPDCKAKLVKFLEVLR